VGRATDKLREWAFAPVAARRRRRYNCHQQDDPRWEHRAQAAAELLASAPDRDRAMAPDR